MLQENLHHRGMRKQKLPVKTRNRNPEPPGEQMIKRPKSRPDQNYGALILQSQARQRTENKDDLMMDTYCVSQDNMRGNLCKPNHIW